MGGFLGGKLRTIILTFLLLFGALGLHAQENVVTIEQARQTDYYTDEATEDEIVVFTGGVVISVVQGKTTSRIQAEQVSFNRSQNLLYAIGNVTLDRDTGNGEPEQMTAESILFNIDSQEGIFHSGTVVQGNSGTIQVDTDSRLVASAELFARDDSGTVAFKRGTLTFCEEPDPHWKIKASRIWLLPGNEFAFANALLYIGKVPVMYFPFFYYPKDELIFNPVFGYDQRKGYTIQTSTYLIGRKKPTEKKDEDSFFSFLNSSTMYKQRREGLVLRNLEEKDSSSYPHTLKFMADYYTNLGGMVGLEGAFTPENAYISKLDFFLNLGFSRTLFPVSQGGVNVYTPYDENGETQYNGAYFAGMSLPFRYRGNFNLSMTKPFTLNVALPLYSDPFFNQDFFEDRRETMDWFDFALSSGSAAAEEEETTTSGEISSFLWRITASGAPKLEAVSPYLSKVSLSPGFDLNFYSLTDVSDLTVEEAKVSPSRKAFYPGLIKPFYLSGTISGEIFSYPFPKKSTTVGGLSPWPKVEKEKLNVPEEFLSEEERVQVEAAETVDAGLEDDVAMVNGSGEEEDPEEKSPIDSLSIPTIVVAKPATQPIDGLDYKLTYSISPNFSSEIGYVAPQTKKDFKWDDINSTFLYLKVPVSLTSGLKYRNNFFSLTNGLTFTPVYQHHPIYENEQQRQTIQRNDYAARKLDLDNSNTVSLAPFVFHPIFSGTTISWNASVRVIRTSFIGTVEEPEWDYELPAWDYQSFASHNLTVNLKSQEGSFYQQVNLSTVLPPLREAYSGTLTLGFPYVTASLGAGIQHKSVDDKEWVLQPLTQNLTVKFFDNKLTFTENYRYNLEDKYNDTFSLSLSGYNLTFSFAMRYVASYDYDPQLGWKLKSEKEFQPDSMELRYTYSSSKKRYFWKNRIALTPGVNTTIRYNFLQPTSSYFTFEPSITFTINEFLDLTFKSSSRNDVIYRYIQDYTGFEPQIPGETNVFKDLWNSFSFWDKGKREASGFKLKSLEVSLNHQLHDWTLSSQFKVSPRTISEGGKNVFDFSPHFTLSVVWKPMNSMKTTIEDKYGTVTLNP